MNHSFLSHEEAIARRVQTNWGDLLWLADATIGNAAGLTLGRVTIKAGESNPRHCHPNCEEVLYLMSGKLEHTVGDEVVTLSPGDSLTIPAGMFHNARSIAEVDADMIVAYSEAERGFVLESENEQAAN
jgi:quercetin dioxygenase-like cupin family protein